MLQPPRGSTSNEYTREAEDISPTTAEVVVMKCNGLGGMLWKGGVPYIHRCCGGVGFPTSIYYYFPPLGGLLLTLCFSYIIYIIYSYIIYIIVDWVES